jgi:predicted MFS family arabinose efflux permease
MFLVRGIAFLIPLFVTEVFGFPATKTGLLVACNSVSLLLTMRLGGVIADRFSIRFPVTAGLAVQMASLIMLALLRESGIIAPIIVALVLNGGGAGLSISALHHTAMYDMPVERAGAAAGLYSMIRFIGSLFGIAVVGVVLEHAIGARPSLAAAYTASFAVLAVIAGAGVLLSFLLKEVKRV